MPLRSHLRQFWHRRRILLTASGIALSVIGVRLLGILQPLELAMLDQGFRWRSVPPPDERIVIVGITESDIRQLNQWPLSDVNLAALIRKVQQGQPQVIGLDLYRDLQTQSGSTEINQLFRSAPNIFGIWLLQQPNTKDGIVRRLEDAIAVHPPAVLADKQQIGFNNTIQDVDQRVRRSLLYWPVPLQQVDAKGQGQIQTQYYESFALKIAQYYLKQYGTTPQAAAGYKNPRVLQLGKAILPPLQQSDGLYMRADTGGYQIFANYRGPAGHFKQVSVLQVLQGELPADIFRDRIVLIGSVASSLKDSVATPFSTLKHNSPQLMSGVELQANLVSQLITAARTGQGLFHALPEMVEWVWVWAAAYWGTYISWWLRSPRKSLMIIGASSVGLIILTYSAFLSGWIVPLLPPLLALLGASTVVTYYIAHAEQEMNRSKEFLAQVIDSIPDPIFVKDRHHAWVVLNQAYADFIGVPIATLLGRTVHHVFPAAQAQWLRTQDEWVFGRQQTQEIEEEFVNLQGQHYHISTKRSLHRDRAGNVFLVGVIHDITQRKTLEEELKRARDKLSQDNTELSYLANHDPLTGLPNRKLFLECLQQAIAAAAIANHPHHQVALLFLDLDGFKAVNDTLGHSIGDLLLQAVAQRLQACLRAGSDIVARLGGDEFVVVLPQIPGALIAKRVAQKILATLATEFTIESHTIHVTTSIGISLYPQDSTGLDSLIQSADTAMYESKNCGKNRYTLAKEIHAKINSRIR
jgi:diguanylate cyclase (GGDEF)-like protein/PAS domain S-box-containing protein